MTGTFQLAADQGPVAVPDFNVFQRYTAGYPWISHGVWILSQMLRWGQIDQALDLIKVSRGVYRPKLFREAAEALGWPAPKGEMKPEGVHDAPWRLDDPAGTFELGADRFMDGRPFDPHDPIAYLEGFDIAHLKVGLDRLKAVNTGTRAVA
jgi:nitrate/nitrite transport system substrate-binding protein